MCHYGNRSSGSGGSSSSSRSNSRSRSPQILKVPLINHSIGDSAAMIREGMGTDKTIASPSKSENTSKLNSLAA